MRHYATGLTLAWVIATLAIAYLPIAAALGNPSVPIWLGVALSCVTALGCLVWWFWMGFWPMRARRRAWTLALATLAVGWGSVCIGAQIVAAPSSGNWSTLDDPGIGYMVAGVLSPLFVAVPASIAAGFGYLWRLNRRPRSNPREFG